MCIKCELLKTVAGAFGAEIKEIEVGTVAPEFLAELTQLEEAESKLEAQVEKALEAAAESVHAEFDNKIESLEDLKHKAWKDAIASAGIDLMKQAGDYSINKKTGAVTITKVVKIEDEKAAEGVH